MLTHLHATLAQSLTQDDKSEIVTIVAVSGGIVIALVAIIGGMITSWIKTRHRERTRRELAAYVAEGTMKPEDAVAILEASPEKAAMKQFASK